MVSALEKLHCTLAGKCDQKSYLTATSFEARGDTHHIDHFTVNWLETAIPPGALSVYSVVCVSDVRELPTPLRSLTMLLTLG